MKKILKCLLLLIIGFNVLLIGQNSGIVKGRLTNTKGDPLPGANVIISGRLENGDTLDIASSSGAATNMDGYYSIRGIEPGEYILKASYIGYVTKKTSVVINEGKRTTKNIELTSASLQYQEVQITAQAEGQNSAINQQLSSNTVSNVVSADRMKDIPDRNAAESVGRLPGVSVQRSGGEGQKVAIRGLSPKYNVMQVSGVRMQSSDPNNRSVKINMISPNALSGIEVKKALTADMDADAVGGTVNLKVGKAEPGFNKSFSIQGGYSGIAENKFEDYKINGSLSNRFFEDKFGVKTTGFYESYNRGSHRLYSNFSWNGNTDNLDNFWLETVDIEDVDIDRKRYGASLVLDYQLSNGFFKYTGFASRLANNSITQQNEFGAHHKTWAGSATDSESRTTIFNNALRGEFDFDIIQMDFSTAYSFTQNRIPGDLSMSMGPYRGGSLLTGWSNPDTTTQGDEVHMTPVDFINTVETATDRAVKELSTFERNNRSSAFTQELNFEAPFNFGNYISGNLKFGGKYVQNKRRNDEENYSMDAATGINVSAIRDSVGKNWESHTGYKLIGPDGTRLQPDDEGLPAQLFHDPAYSVGDFLSAENVRDGIFTNKIDISRMNDLEEFARNSTITSPVGGGKIATNPMYQKDPFASFENDFNYTRNYMAFYLMPTLNIGEYITFIPGIRYEKFGFDYTAYKIFVTDQAGYPGDRSYYTKDKINKNTTEGENWFPQMQLKIQPADWLDIRLASTKSIIYPDYQAVSPYLYKDTFKAPRVDLGNPSLKPATSQNYDFQVSVYDNHIGLFTAGLFHKRIEDLIASVSYLTKDASVINNRTELSESALTSINTWKNLEDPSYVKGFELSWQTNFWYLPNPLNGLVFNVNYTKMQSESYYTYIRTKKTGTAPFYNITYSDTTRKGRMEDQADDILNFTVGYDIGGLSARLSYQYKNDVLENAHNRYATLDVHTKPYSRWDFTAYQDLPWAEGLELFLNINNITNEPDSRYQNKNAPRFLSRAEYYGTTGEFGIRYDF